MLRRLLRSLGSLGALWTLVVLSSPVRLHACPEGHQVAASAPAEHSGHGAHAGDDGPVVDPSGDHSAVPSAGDCDCIDCCCATESTAVAVGMVVAVEASAWPQAIAAESAEASAPASAVPHRLPFANGPPGLIG